MSINQERLREISGHIENRSEAIIQTLGDLVRINTVNPYAGGKTLGNETPGQHYLQPRLDALGLQTKMSEVRPDVYEAAGILGPAGRNFQSRPNLVAEVSFSEPGPHLLLFAHIDTVGVDEMTIPPFEPTRKDGRIYGRGSSDDKSGIAVGFHAIEALLSLDLPLRGKITFASVVDEECDGGGSGIMDLCLNGLTPDAAICLDGPADALYHGCNGVITGRIQVPGVSAHASSPAGVSALEKALLIKNALEPLRREREEETPTGLFNLGVLRAGSHPAMVPGAAEMFFNLAYIAGEADAAHRSGHGRDGSLLRARIEEIVAGVSRDDPFLKDHPATVTWVKDLPPYNTPKDSRILASFLESYAAFALPAPDVRIAPFWTDAAIFSVLTGREVINFGSGAGKAHAPDEYVEEKTLTQNVKLLTHVLAMILSSG